MTTTERKHKIAEAAFWLAALGFLCVFFAVIHPLQVWDGDDWLYISWHRNAYPLWKAWNPSRILPETFMSMVAGVGVYAVYPFTKDYLQSITLINALAISLSIVIYMYMFFRLVRNRSDAGKLAAYMLTAFFLLFHFSIFRRFRSDNTYMFYASNLTGYFFYVLPNVLNASLVLYFMGNKDGSFLTGKKRDGFVILLVYLAVFSDFFQTIILISYMGARILFDLIKNKKVCRSMIFPASVIAVWFISIFFEVNGGRAASNSGQIPLSESIKLFFGWTSSLNLQTAAVMTGMTVLGIILFVIKKKNERDEVKPVWEQTLIAATCAAVSSVFLILLCSVTGSEHMQRSGVIFAVAFFGFIIAFMSAVAVLKDFPKGIIVMPLLFYILLSNTYFGTHTFRETNWQGYSPAVCKALMDDYIDQLKKADECGATSVDLRVPEFFFEADGDNWPHAYGMGNAMADTLYAHGVLTHEMDVTVCPDPSMNVEYHLDLYE
ncbi:MAG: hypothetical protein J6N47_00790 [Lachnospiraceae bacterium]|nr:hypothetical protein [Lachnospiraceae bacterium]